MEKKNEPEEKNLLFQIFLVATCAFIEFHSEGSSNEIFTNATDWKVYHTINIFVSLRGKKIEASKKRKKERDRLERKKRDVM